MKFTALAALLRVSALDTERFYYHPQYIEMSSSSGSSSSSSSDDEAVALHIRGGDDYPAAMSGFGGYHTYIRDTPDRFESEADDALMRSMYSTYATEGKKDGLPTGQFWVTAADAKKAATEVVATHLHLKEKALESYVEDNFKTYWAKYDVNGEGKIEVDRMPVFLRSVCGSAEGCAGLQ